VSEWDVAMRDSFWFFPRCSPGAMTARRRTSALRFLQNEAIAIVVLEWVNSRSIFSSSPLVASLWWPWDPFRALCELSFSYIFFYDMIAV
jgi:hypothetical protein